MTAMQWNAAPQQAFPERPVVLGTAQDRSRERARDGRGASPIARNPNTHAPFHRAGATKSFEEDTPMATTVIGTIESSKAAQALVSELVKAGLNKQDIAVLDGNGPEKQIVAQIVERGF